MDDVTAYLRELRKRGYRLAGGGKKHVRVYLGGALVATASSTPGQGNRSLENLKGQVRRFERAQLERAGGRRKEEGEDDK